MEIDIYVYRKKKDHKNRRQREMYLWKKEVNEGLVIVLRSSLDLVLLDCIFTCSMVNLQCLWNLVAQFGSNRLKIVKCHLYISIETSHYINHSTLVITLDCTTSTKVGSV